MNIFFKRKAILLIHGFAGGLYDYGELPNDLELINNFDVFTFTLPGHEKTIINNVTKEDWIKKAENQIQKLIENNYTEIYVIGHSMGGVIASHLASKYKEVKKLVLASPAFEYFTFKEDKLDIIESIKKVPKIFKDYSSEELMSRILKSPIMTIKEFMSLVDTYKGEINNITCPTLIIWGNKDEIVPINSVNYVYNNLNSKSITLYEINNLTHDLFINNRYNEVKKIIVTFLKSKPSNKKEKYNI